MMTSNPVSICFHIFAFFAFACLLPFSVTCDFFAYVLWYVFDHEMLYFLQEHHDKVARFICITIWCFLFMWMDRASASLISHYETTIIITITPYWPALFCNLMVCCHCAALCFASICFKIAYFFMICFTSFPLITLIWLTVSFIFWHAD